LCPLRFSASGQEAQRIEEMEKMLKEAQQEKARLVENRVSLLATCHTWPSFTLQTLDTSKV
jgi:hypothetical protein